MSALMNVWADVTCRLHVRTRVCARVERARSLIAYIVRDLTYLHVAMLECIDTCSFKCVCVCSRVRARDRYHMRVIMIVDERCFIRMNERCE